MMQFLAVNEDSLNSKLKYFPDFLKEGPTVICKDAEKDQGEANLKEVIYFTCFLVDYEQI